MDNEAMELIKTFEVVMDELYKMHITEAKGTYINELNQKMNLSEKELILINAAYEDSIKMYHNMLKKCIEKMELATQPASSEYES